MEDGFPAVEVWRGGRADRAFRQHAAWGAVQVCGVRFPNPDTILCF